MADSHIPNKPEQRRTNTSDLPKGTVSMFFTDIEGSTYLLEQLGERYNDVLAEYRSLLRTVFHAFDGHELDTQGDSFFVAFARATDAVSAAVEMQRTLFAHSWSNSVTVRARIGLHTGEPQLSAEGYVGLDVHHTARIMSAGHGGQVLLSAATCELVKHNLPDGVSLRDLGERRLKDVQHPSPLFQLLIADLPNDFPPLKTLDSHPNNLPIQPTPFIGRDQQVAAILHLLSREEVRLLTLTGPGGTGKTRLGLQVAAELSETFTDGMYFVNLAPLSDPHLVVSAIAQTLGIKEVAGQSLLDLLKGVLHWKHLLLLLDNFEQVVDAAVDVAGLLAVCPNLKVLVTSRMSLHVRGEQEFAVPPLTVPDPKHLPDLVSLSHYEAVALFISRAQAVKPEFQVSNANAPAIAEICVRLDGLPLAIELAAARIKLLPPQALLARLGQWLVVLTSGARDAPARQQTLRNTIKWSYDLLDAQEQRLFCWLSVFVGGCTLEAIEAVCHDAGDEKSDVLNIIASLVDKSLVQQVEQETGEPRLTMLETVREYALECLGENEEAEVCQRRVHAMHYLALAEEAEPHLKGAQRVLWWRRLEQDHDNLRAAMSWLLEREETELALRLGGVLWGFWVDSSYQQEGWHLLERALAASGEVAAAMRSKALLAAGELAGELGHFERGAVLCEQSLALFREIGDTKGMGVAAFYLGWNVFLRGDLAVARSLLEESIQLSSKADNKHRVGRALTLLGHVAAYQSEFVRACELLDEALALSREMGDIRAIGDSLSSLAVALFLQGDLERARALVEETLDTNREMGVGRLAEAESLHLLGEITFSQGDMTTARLLFEQSYALYREEGNEAGMAGVLLLLARVSAAQSDLAAARALCEESLIRGKGVNHHLSYQDLAPALEGLATVVAAQGELAWAARLWGRAEAHRDAYGLPLAPVYHADYDRAVAATRTQLGEQAFAAAWAEGRTMTLEQVITTPESTMMFTASQKEPATPPKVSTSPTYPDKLTAREVEVLRLIAKGLTNDQVAELLVISPRTVNTHLTSIYGKIGVASRSGATRYAIDHTII